MRNFYIVIIIVICYIPILLLYQLSNRRRHIYDTFENNNVIILSIYLMYKANCKNKRCYSN